MTGKYQVHKYIDKFRGFLKSKKINLINRDGIYEILICPKCLKEKFKYKKKKLSYVCKQCNFSLTKEEFQEFAKIEYQKGFLFDFNLGKEPMHKVFDHHGIYDVEMLKTATIEVLDYISYLKKLNNNAKGLSLVLKYKEGLKEYIQNNKFNLYVNHIDVDSVLSVFAFRNPNFAIQYESIFRKLSYYADLILLDEEIEEYCYIIHGIINALNSNNYSQDKIFDFLLLNLKEIILYPKRFRQYIELEKEFVTKDLNLLIKSTDNNTFKILKGFNNKVVEFKTPKGFREFVALFQFLKDYEKGKYNLPFLIKLSSNTDIYSVSANANVIGFENICLANLSNIILDTERNKILSLKVENEYLIRKKKNLERKLIRISIMVKNDNFLKTLHKLRELIVHDRFKEFKSELPKLIESLENININMSEVYSIKGICDEIYRVKDSFMKNTQVVPDDVKIRETVENIQNCRFDDANSSFKIGKNKLNEEKRKKFFSLFKIITQEKGIVIKKITDLIREMGGQLVVKERDIKKELRIFKLNEIRGNISKIWIFKSNLLMVNAEYRSNLSYEEFKEVIRKNLNKAYIQ